MKGHQTLIDMRMAGVRPRTAALCLYPLEPWVLRWSDFTAHAEIEIDAEDRIGRLDLRFLVGMPIVWAEGDDPERLRELFDACVAAGALRVIAVQYAAGKVVRMFDNQEMQWRN